MRLTSSLKFCSQFNVHLGDGADRRRQKEPVLGETLSKVVHDAQHLNSVITSLAHSDVDSPFGFVLEFFHDTVYDTIDWWKTGVQVLRLQSFSHYFFELTIQITGTTKSRLALSAGAKRTAGLSLTALWDFFAL